MTTTVAPEFAARFRQHQLIQRAPKRRPEPSGAAAGPGRIRPIPGEGGLDLSLGRLRHGIGSRPLYDRYLALTETPAWAALGTLQRRLLMHAIAEARGDERQLEAAELLLSSDVGSLGPAAQRCFRLLERLGRAPERREAFVRVVTSGLLGKLPEEARIRALDFLDGPNPVSVGRDPWSLPTAELADAAATIAGAEHPGDALDRWLDAPSGWVQLLEPIGEPGAFGVQLGDPAGDGSVVSYLRTVELGADREPRAMLRRYAGPARSDPLLGRRRCRGTRAEVARSELLALLRWIDDTHVVASARGASSPTDHKGRLDAAFDLDVAIKRVLVAVTAHRGRLDFEPVERDAPGRPRARRPSGRAEAA